ncbi:MAG TPA: MerR family transcriptional regulator [Aquabacterium sp.]|uniref:MerR family transcriptional regulator n=1 Tax=Aquabacterium sp. TaxID=1872578 RepID=UPI002E342446|nr:MerR family transcriptional regulator [Aquabacterium sp.]HEX5373229.1 MerR family transcriptional regulator [Aquabacterium sp.]
MDNTLLPAGHGLMMSIAAVERDTGLSKDTLRVWERRYGFPQPARDPQGERAYPLDQIERLRLIKRLLDVGHRPSRLVHLDMSDLRALSERTADAQGLDGPIRRRALRTTPPTNTPATPTSHGRAHLLASASAPTWSAQVPGPTPQWVERCLVHVDRHDPIGLRRELAHCQNRLGLARFISDLAAPLLTAVGNGWLRGRFQVYQEHWVSHYLQQALHAAIQTFPVLNDDSHPRVLLSTLPGEHHSLGLLMVECWLCLEQAQPINLGPQTPVWDLVHAAQACHADVVALSFSAYAQPQLITDALPELRQKLPPHIELWVGGSHPLLQRRPPEGVTVLNDMPRLTDIVSDWRQRHAPAPTEG